LRTAVCLDSYRAKVYLETTIFNRYFEDSREYCAETRALFARILFGEIKAFASVTVLEEIDKAPESKRGQMIGLVQKYDITILEPEENAYTLADLYIDIGIIPLKYRLDGVHIALATINNMDYIVSLNFHHINKLKTKMATEIVNRMKGYGYPFICTPMEVIDEND
jgi:hypothetical protein